MAPIAEGWAVLIGVTGDSHDNLPAIERAMALLGGRGVEHVLHAGDIVAPFAAKAFLELEVPVTAAFGNNDGERAGLAKVIEDIHEPPHRFALAGRTVVLAHDMEALTGAVLDGVDLAVYGHTHRPEIRREGETLLLNPGEVGGWVTGRRTCAVVDLEALSAEILDL